ncbi:MAG: hypothetical protein AAF432_10955 [Planctomycetota bacterium]
MQHRRESSLAGRLGRRFREPVLGKHYGRYEPEIGIVINVVCLVGLCFLVQWSSWFFMVLAGSFVWGIVSCCRSRRSRQRLDRKRLDARQGIIYCDHCDYRIDQSNSRACPECGKIVSQQLPVDSR